MSDALRGYRPRAMPAKQWERIRPAAQTIGLIAAAAGVQATTDMMTAIGQLLAWADKQGMELDPVALLQDDLIERHALTIPGLTPGGRRTRLSLLRRCSEALLLDQLGTRPRVRLRAGQSPTTPYSPPDLANWMIWVRHLPTELQRRNGTLLIALGRGCGIAAEDLALMTGRHIVPGPGGRVVVQVPGSRERQVLCRYAFERVLLQAACSIEADEWLFRPDFTNRDSKHLISGWTDKHPRRTGREELETLSLQRLRTAWLVDLIECAIPLQVLLAASGLKTLHGLTRYLQFVPPVAPETAADHLRGRRPHGPR